MCTGLLLREVILAKTAILSSISVDYAPDILTCAACEIFIHVLRQIELKNKYKFRLILDESFSFGAVGRTGRGLTELYNVPVRRLSFSFNASSHSFARRLTLT